MQSLSSRPSFAERWTRLTARERRLLALGSISVPVFLAYLMTPSAADETVVLAADPPPAPASVLPTPATVEIPQSVAAPSAEGIVLRGVMGGGPRGGAAVFRFPDGAERVVRIGRPLLPGLTLKEIGVAHAIVTSAAGDLRLDFGRAGGALTADVASAASPPATATSADDHRRETLQYRLGLAAQKTNGRIAGFAIRPGATLPALQRAGLRPGDILVAVNGQPFESEEKVLELAQEIAGSYTAEFEFLSGGRRMKASLDVNERP